MDVFSSLWALIREPFFSCSVAASFGNATVEYIDEHLLDDQREKSDKDAVGLLTLVSGFFGIVIAAIILGYAAVTGSVSDIQIGQKQMLQVLLSGALEVVWMIPYLKATNRVGTMSAAPLFQTIPIFSFILGFFFFKEQLILTHVIASVVIVLGALLLSVNRDTLRLDRLTIGQMLLASFIIAFVYSVFKDATIKSNLMATLFWSGIGMTMMSAVLWVIKKSYRDAFNQFIRSPSKKLVVLQLVNEGVNAVSVTATHFAVVKAPSVMVATALNAFHPVFILMFGWLMGKNGSNKHSDALSAGEGLKKVIAISLIVLGTALIAL